VRSINQYNAKKSPLNIQKYVEKIYSLISLSDLGNNRKLMAVTMKQWNLSFFLFAVRNLIIGHKFLGQESILSTNNKSREEYSRVIVKVCRIELKLPSHHPCSYWSGIHNIHSRLVVFSQLLHCRMECKTSADVNLLT
jgi:hypothetical protein